MNKCICLNQISQFWTVYKVIPILIAMSFTLCKVIECLLKNTLDCIGG